MSISTTEIAPARAVAVRCDEDSLTVELADGRVISAPLGWYPRLSHGTPEERANWRLTADGEAVHWPALDEDLSVDSIVAGRRSMESAKSFARWLDGRRS